MTHIVPYPTKKAFREAVIAKAGLVYVADPSTFNPCPGYVCDVVTDICSITVTNHPKRSWFAAVRRDRAGNLKVS